MCTLRTDPYSSYSSKEFLAKSIGNSLRQVSLVTVSPETYRTSVSTLLGALGAPYTRTHNGNSFILYVYFLHYMDNFFSHFFFPFDCLLVDENTKNWDKQMMVRFDVGRTFSQFCLFVVYISINIPESNKNIYFRWIPIDSYMFSNVC